MQRCTPRLEILEDRIVPSVLDVVSNWLASFAPITSLHYANGGNFHFGAYNAPGDPGSAGFNLVDINSPASLAAVPPGCKALVVIDGVPGVTPGFIQTITPYIGNPKVFGFYLADEPDPASVPAENIKAESDWIHANFPGAKTFAVLGSGPFFGSPYTPASTHLDYVGLDPYPVRTFGYVWQAIPLAVLTAEWQGWGQSQIVPVYQAFGGTGTFAEPTRLEVSLELAIWGLLTPSPAFDYAYSWGSAWGSVALVGRADLQAVFVDHNG